MTQQPIVIAAQNPTGIEFSVMVMNPLGEEKLMPLSDLHVFTVGVDSRFTELPHLGIFLDFNNVALAFRAGLILDDGYLHTASKKYVEYAIQQLLTLNRLGIVCPTGQALMAKYVELLNVYESVGQLKDGAGKPVKLSNLVFDIHSGSDIINKLFDRPTQRVLEDDALPACLGELVDCLTATHVPQRSHPMAAFHVQGVNRTTDDTAPTENVSVDTDDIMGNTEHLHRQALTEKASDDKDVAEMPNRVKDVRSNGKAVVLYTPAGGTYIKMVTREMIAPLWADNTRMVIPYTLDVVYHSPLLLDIVANLLEFLGNSWCLKQQDTYTVRGLYYLNYAAKHHFECDDVIRLRDYFQQLLPNNLK